MKIDDKFPCFSPKKFTIKRKYKTIKLKDKYKDDSHKLIKTCNISKLDNVICDDGGWNDNDNGNGKNDGSSNGNGNRNNYGNINVNKDANIKNKSNSKNKIRK